MDWWPVITWSLAGTLAVIGVLWIDRGLRRASSSHTGQPEACPACAYDLAGLCGCTCPECGMNVHAPLTAARIRIAARACLPGAASIIIAVAAALAPGAVRNGPLSLLPTSVLIVMLPWAPDQALSLHSELTERIRGGELSRAQGRMLAARCLGVITNHALPTRRAGAAEVLAASPDRSETTALAVAAALRHRDTAVRIAVLPACGVLAREHPVVREAIIATIADDTCELARSRAVDVLRRCGHSSNTAATVLSVAATGDSPRLRQRAVYAIGAASPATERAGEILSRALVDDDEAVREAALTVLRDRAHTDDAAVPLLTGGLADPSRELRIWTALQLRVLGAAAVRAIPALLAATSDHDSEVRAAAGEALADILRHFALIAPRLGA